MSRFSKYEKILYILAVVVSLATIVCIIRDFDEIKTYYKYKKSAIIQEEEKKAYINTLFDGNGTEKNPYTINNVNQLKSLKLLIESGNNCAGLYFNQMADIDLQTEETWWPIGNDSVPFCGTYDGGGHVISNLRLTEDDTSFFGNLGGRIKNLGVQNVYFEASNSAVFANSVQKNATFINCYITKVNVTNSVFANGLFANDFSGGILLNCISDGRLPFVTYANESGTSIYNCTGNIELYDANQVLNVNKDNNSVFKDFYETCNFEQVNNALCTLTKYNITGNYNKLEITERGILQFSEETVLVINDQHMVLFWKYIRNILIYLIFFIILIVCCCAFSRKFHWNLKKCIVYTLLSACALLVFGYGYLSEGTSFMALLYDGISDGRLKVFTDFFDCLRPGFNPYAGGDNGISTIYPPLITLLFAILGKFIPKSELFSSIAARDSQMGSVLFVLCIVVTTILFYEVIFKFKKGNKTEKVFFSLLLLTTYPMIHCVERGNVTILCAICIVVFLFYYRAETYGKRQIALISLAIAVGIKIYPAVLGVLLLREKRYKDTLNCIAYGITLNIVPSLCFTTGLSSVVYMVINATTMISNNSVIGGKIDLPHLIQMPGEMFGVKYDLTGYLTIISVFILLIAIVVVLFSKMEDWKIYSVIILSLIVLESFSPFYYLLYMIAPLMLFLDSSVESKMKEIVYSVMFVGIYMTFATTHKYPFYAFAPNQVIWQMTPISGFFTMAFLAALLIEGVYRCIGRVKNIKGAKVK